MVLPGFLALCVAMLACNKTNPDATVEPTPETTLPPTEHAGDDEPEQATPSDEDEARERARNAPPPAGLAAGVIADFESGELRSEFGAGWQLATDAMQGGASKVKLSVENGAMKMVGTIDEGSLPDAWAGAMFFPGDQAMRPANLDSKPTLMFQARGDGPLMVMVFAEQLGTTPAKTQVEIGEEWAKYEVDLRTLVAEPYDVTAIFFGGPPRAGQFEVHVDDVRLR
ncbi:hypothetical protein [Paraliomyxa miuraensis]|uniref:hypothetical protein n=1 Tax=Paraliomyxa miuraensis TaxID=376150 RepID=UPI00224D611A|nr:hypothetical protein [Paraliomyxa miuraensis]